MIYGRQSTAKGRKHFQSADYSQGRSKHWKTWGRGITERRRHELSRRLRGMLARKILKISLSENVFTGFWTSFETKSECLKQVKYFPLLSGQFAEGSTIFWHRLYYLFPLELVTGCCVHVRMPPYWHHSSHKSCDNSVKTFWFRFSRNYPAQSTYPKYSCDFYLRNLLIRLVSKLSKNENSWRTNVWINGSVVSADMVVNYSFLWYESVVATSWGKS